MYAIEIPTQLAVGGTPPGTWTWIMAISFAAICVIMMLVVLIQKPKGGGLSGAFGGGAGGGSESAFIGGRVGDLLTWVTIVCAFFFLVLAVLMTWSITDTGLFASGDDATEEQAEEEKPPAESEGAGAASSDEDTESEDE